MEIIISGIGACTAAGDSADKIAATFRSGHSPLQPQLLAPGFSPIFGAVPDTPPLSSREHDFTATFAGAAARTALQQANLAGRYASDRVATIIGCSKGRLHGIAAANPPQVDPRQLPGETVGREIAAAHSFTGAVLNYPEACATGLACLVAGANLLRDDLADAAVIGSAEASGFLLTLSSFANMAALSRNQMRPFHRDRDGFNPGEGAGVLVLEREREARSRSAKPLARLCGFDIRSDAHHITAPEASGATIAQSIRRTLRMAGWSPSEVEYINAHGTGTPRNDEIEARAIFAVFSDNCPPVSSLKPVLGHLLGGCAATELAAVIMLLRTGYIPPTLGLDRPDPELAPIHHVPPGGIQRPVHRVLKISLGFGGHIASAALEIV